MAVSVVKCGRPLKTKNKVKKLGTRKKFDDKIENENLICHLSSFKPSTTGRAPTIVVKLLISPLDRCKLSISASAFTSFSNGIFRKHLTISSTFSVVQLWAVAMQLQVLAGSLSTASFDIADPDIEIIPFILPAKRLNFAIQLKTKKEKSSNGEFTDDS